MIDIIRVFVGYDAREAAGTWPFLQTLREKTKARVLIELVGGEQGDGTNAFGAHERFLAPAKCGFRGWSLFLDGADMLLRAPLEELIALIDRTKAVQVVKHDYRTRHPVKYLGTELQAPNVDYPRKNWSSVVIFRNDHSACQRLTPEFVRAQSAKSLHRFEWVADEYIGELPAEWNWLADEYGYNPNAKLLHWTAGIPGFNDYRDAPHADEWHAALNRAMRGLQTHALVESSRTIPSER